MDVCSHVLERISLVFTSWSGQKGLKETHELHAALNRIESEAPTKVNMKIIGFWDVRPYRADGGFLTIQRSLLPRRESQAGN
jgi:hypothetical protein